MSYIAMLLKSQRLVLKRKPMLDWLGKLPETAGECVSLYLPAGSGTDEVQKLLGGLENINAAPDLAKMAALSPTGSVIFWSNSRKCLVMPPFPFKEKVLFQGCEGQPLQSLLQRDFIVGLVLIRMGAFAIGVTRGDKLITSKVGTGLVHARHRQGGSSSHRFERHRDKQIETFLTRVCEHVREQIEPYAREMDYLVYGGARETILLLQKQCTFLKRLNTETLPPLLTIHDPRQPVLESAVEQVWATQIIEWH